MILFKLGKGEFAIPVESVQEVIKTPDITNIPNTPVYFKGIINLRNRVVAVIDLCDKLGVDEKQKADTRVIVVNLQDRTLGLIVDTVTEVIKLDEANIETSYQSSDTCSVQGIYRLGERLLMLLDLELLYQALDN
jgi:purine-binding chemotaxis protein CheW